MTYDEAVAQWKSENPMPITVHEDGENREITEEEYEAMAADRAQMLMAQSEQQAAEDADVAEGKGILDRVKALETTAGRLKDPAQTFTNQQLRNVMGEHMLVTADSIRYIHKHSNLPSGEG